VELSAKNCNISTALFVELNTGSVLQGNIYWLPKVSNLGAVPSCFTISVYVLQAIAFVILAKALSQPKVSIQQEPAEASQDTVAPSVNVCVVCENVVAHQAPAK